MNVGATGCLARGMSSRVSEIMLWIEFSGMESCARGVADRGVSGLIDEDWV